MQIRIPNCAISGDNLAIAMGGDESDHRQGKKEKEKEIRNETNRQPSVVTEMS